MPSAAAPAAAVEGAAVTLRYVMIDTLRYGMKSKTPGVNIRTARPMPRSELEYLGDVRSRFRQEAVTSWEHYCETGLHLTGDEVHAWLNTWGTANESAVPECHK